MPTEELDLRLTPGLDRCVYTHKSTPPTQKSKHQIFSFKKIFVVFETGLITMPRLVLRWSFQWWVETVRPPVAWGHLTAAEDSLALLLLL